MITPSVGRVVHYVSHGTPVREDGSQDYVSECRAAIITATCTDPVEDPSVSLAVLNPKGLFFDASVGYDPSGAAGTWHWPGRVE